MKSKPRMPSAKAQIEQLQRFAVTAGKALRQLQRRVDKLENRDRIIRGFGPVECVGYEVEQPEE